MRRGFGPSEFRLTVRMLHSLLYSIHDCISSSSVAAPMAYDVGANALVDETAVGIPFPEPVRQTARFWLAIDEPPPIVRGAKAPTGI